MPDFTPTTTPQAFPDILPDIFEDVNIRRLAEAIIYIQANGLLASTGDIKMFAGPVAPPGTLFCDGSSLLRADYPALFIVIGTTFGSVDGTHFTLPDLRNRCPVGVGTRTLAATGGEETHVLTTGEL